MGEERSVEMLKSLSNWFKLLLEAKGKEIKQRFLDFHLPE